MGKESFVKRLDVEGKLENRFTSKYLIIKIFRESYTGQLVKNVRRRSYFERSIWIVYGYTIDHCIKTFGRRQSDQCRALNQLIQHIHDGFRHLDFDNFLGWSKSLLGTSWNDQKMIFFIAVLSRRLIFLIIKSRYIV